MSPTSNTVLMIDDDPSHLKVYSWILERGGFQPLTVLATSRGVEIPATDTVVGVVVMDYRLGIASPITVAQQVRSVFPVAPIIVLSDVFGMPTDIAPYVQTFVRKGDPEHLLSEIRSALAN